MLRGVIVQRLLQESAPHALIEHPLRDLRHARRLTAVLSTRPIVPLLEIIRRIVVLAVPFFLATDPVEFGWDRPMLQVLPNDEVQPRLQFRGVDRAEVALVYLAPSRR